MPRQYYTLPVTDDIRIITSELNRILDDISRRLNYMFEAGQNVDAGDQKIINLKAGVANSDGVRLDQVLSLSDLASVILGTALEIEITDNGDNTITIGIIDPLTVAKGGIGVATLTNHGVLLGSGTGAITPLAVAADGELVVGSAGVDPVLATLTGTADEVVVTNAAGSITLSFAAQAKETNNKARQFFYGNF